MPATDNPVKEYRITEHEMQTIDGFGASDAWSMQTMGLWKEDEQKKVADWLFSTENNADGQPKGIGLSIWRFNVGAGSEEQGEESQINRGTRTECFLNADGTYNWDKQLGQRRFLHLAKERGVHKFLAFLNSPPVYYTQNGLATNTGRGGTFNLRDDRYEDFAHFLADVVEGVERHDGIHFDYICPVNEPDGHWNWTGPKQEGTPATNREIARAVRLASKEFMRRGLSTQILVNESSDYRCMFATHETDWQRGYEIQSFFREDSTATFLGNLPNVPRMIVGHSYWTNTPLSGLHDFRCQLRDSLQKYNVDFWQTETCIMGNDEEIGGGGGYDFTMKTALYVARIIHHDIVLAQARSWQWWRAAGGDYKDGLIRMYSGREKRRDGRQRHNNPDDRKELSRTDDFNGAYAKDSKLMWAMGNFSRFVRPGAKRLEVEAIAENGTIVPEGATNPEGVMCSAYKNEDGSMVVVAINYAESPTPFTVSSVPEKASAKKRKKKSAKSGNLKQWNLYRTSDVEGENLKPVGTANDNGAFILPARSITTFVCR
ncbi:MAG: xylanase [Bacteroides sp.]|nr:xylanase [Bacteroides sp.]MCM1421948.1 xylanase [Bacteroides sp.]